MDFIISPKFFAFYTAAKGKLLSRADKNGGPPGHSDVFDSSAMFKCFPRNIIQKNTSAIPLRFTWLALTSPEDRLNNFQRHSAFPDGMTLRARGKKYLSGRL